MRAPASIAFLVLASGLGLSACAPTSDHSMTADSAERTPRQCFDTDRVINFRSDQEHTLYVRAANRDVYELQTGGPCRELETTIGIVLQPSAGGFNRLCIGDWANVGVAGSTSLSGRCRARVVRALTEAEVEALPSRVRP